MLFCWEEDGPCTPGGKLRAGEEPCDAEADTFDAPFIEQDTFTPCNI